MRKQWPYSRQRNVLKKHNMDVGTQAAPDFTITPIEFQYGL